MDFRLVKSIANKYLTKFKKRDFKDINGKWFESAFQHDLLRAGFKCDYDKSFRAVYGWSPSLLRPEDIVGIKDIQTVGDTIFSMFRGLQKDGFYYSTPEALRWFIPALEHLVELAESEIHK